MNRRPIFLLIVLLLSVNAAAASIRSQQEPNVKIIKRVAPEYPEEAERARIQGKVVLDLTVEETGNVSMAKVVSGPAELREAAVDAAKQWRFSNSTKTPVTIQITLRFTLDPDSDTTPQQSSGLKNTYRVNAVYPEEALRKGMEGEVVVEINVNDRGEVASARAISGETLLRQSAVDAAKQFRFTNDLKKTVVAKLTFKFVL
jgi:TonB family protein